MIKPAIPKGTRDFLPEDVFKRTYIFHTIETVFRQFGYLPIETAAMENLNTLTGQYGEEGEKLLFKVLNNGDYLAKADENALTSRDSYALTPSISKRGLRYDLTVPFARFVVMHQNALQFPFKRYQIQPVWRADRPQRGRYQEFYQCDVDVVGSDSLMYEAELVRIYDTVFAALGIDVNIKVNHRKLLFGIAQILGLGDRFSTFAIIIDKLDKIGLAGVRGELKKLGLDDQGCDTLFEIFESPSLDKLKTRVEANEAISEGIADLDIFYRYLNTLTYSNSITLDLTLARGLGYYTGCIFEVKANGVNMGSIGGGGRYANLTESFGLANMSGVGISFGAERIYDVMEELNLFVNVDRNPAKAIFLAFDEASHLYAYGVVNELRLAGLHVDMYPEPAKFKKQFKYADSRGFAYAIIIGSEEMASQMFTCKNLQTGQQEVLDRNQLVQLLQSQ